MKQKINFRMIFIAVLAVVLTTVSIAFAYYSLFRKQVRGDLRTEALILKESGCFDATEADVAEGDGNGSANETEDASESGTASAGSVNESVLAGLSSLEDLRITWISSDGTVLYDNDENASEMENHLDRPEIREAFETGSGESVRQSDTMNMSTYYYAVLLDNGTVLRVAVEARNLMAVFLSAMPLVAGIICVIILICVVLSHFLTRQLIGPIERVVKDMESGVTDPPYRELIPFMNLIRKQHEDILASAKMRQDFTANVSHELKTPLTAISGYAEIIENDMADREQIKRFSAEIRKNSDRLLALINDIIRLSQLDRSEKGQAFENMNLFSVVADCMEALKVNAERRNVTLKFSGTPVFIRGSREMIRELTDNLVQNAIRYNNEGGHVNVTVEGGDSPALIVEDDGIGIPEEDQQRVFERFYRVDKSRSKATGGTGLGLAIVKHIVELHDAHLELESKVGVGTKITVRF